MSHLTIEQKAQAILQDGHRYIFVDPIGSYRLIYKAPIGSVQLIHYNQHGEPVSNMSHAVPEEDLIMYLTNVCYGDTMYWEKIHE